MVKSHFEMPAKVAFYQAAGLLIVFAGYSLLWRHALAGVAAVLIGTISFFAINWISAGILPGLNALWFAFPGVLALLAWYFDRKQGSTLPQ